jgi:hypothetical protein
MRCPPRSDTRTPAGWRHCSYWSVQGQVWEQAVADRTSDVGRWFSWGPEDCAGIEPCTGAGQKGMPGRNVVVPGVGCAQGSWGSDGAGAGARSALASFGSGSYASYLADALANSWSANLGIDGYTIDCSAKYDSCMLQTTTAQADLYRKIVGEVRKTQPQVVMSGEVRRPLRPCRRPFWLRFTYVTSVLVKNY